MPTTRPHQRHILTPKRLFARSGYGSTEAEALRNVKRRVEDYRKGLAPQAQHYTVRKAVENWLEFGQGARAGESTRAKNRVLCETHIIPIIGGQKVQRLTVQQVDEWLAGRAEVLATTSLREVRRCLKNAVRRAMITAWSRRTWLNSPRHRRGDRADLQSP